MKKVFALLALAASLAACARMEQPVNETPEGTETAIHTYTLAVSATKGDGAQTRALTLEGKTLNASWATTENVYVKKGDTWATGSLQPEADGVSATLKGSLTGIDIQANDNLTLQFPNSGDITYTGQLGTLADIQANFDWATASVTVESVSATGDINPTTATTTFTNQQAIIKFTLKDKAGDAAISPSALTVTDATSTVELTSIPAATYTANGDGVLFVAFPAAGLEKTITLTATVGNDTYTYTTSSAKTFTNGQYYEIKVKMTKEVVDLSMVDCAGKARTSRWTANCYMVHTAGDYKLPLVYGNAIKAGVANTAAYNPGGTTSTNYCANFVNHAGTAINAPWITKSTSGEGVNKGMGINVTQAELLWQDAQGLVTAVGIDGDYLTLSVGKNATEQEGNAVIAVKSGSTIVWSWHIWVTKQTFAAADLTTVATGSHDYTVTPVNLGWVGDATSTKGYNTYYQWGRKDAFIPGTGEGNVNHTVYNISNGTVTKAAYSNSSDSDNKITIGDNIQHPTVHYRNTSTKGLCNTEYYNMWDAQQTSNDNTTTAATIKTVYDPCPPGFCVPTVGLYNYIKEQNNTATWQPGYTYNGVFFPASGYHEGAGGKIQSVLTTGYCWSATHDDNTSYSYSRGFYVYNRGWSVGRYYRSTGCPVRAVAE